MNKLLSDYIYDVFREQKEIGYQAGTYKKVKQGYEFLYIFLNGPRFDSRKIGKEVDEELVKFVDNLPNITSKFKNLAEEYFDENYRFNR